MSSTAINDCRRQSMGRGITVVSIAAGFAITGCLLIYGIATLFDIFPDAMVVPGITGEGPLTAGLVSSTAALATFAAAVVFNVVTRVLDASLRTFQIISGIVLLISIPSPFGIDGATTGAIVALLAMHVLVATVSVGFLSKLADR